jgi:teichuronic acid biosynthesis glycosyltransferase TuaG
VTVAPGAGRRPAVSVVIPAYNAADFIEEAVRSALAQTYRPLELVVVNDGSTDDTSALLGRLALEAADVGVVFVLLDDGVNRGAAAALRMGCAAATGEYVCWLSADDAYVDRTKIERQLAVNVRPEVVMTYFRASLVGPETDHAGIVAAKFLPRFGLLERVIEGDPYLRLFMMLFRNPINGSSVMIDREHMRLMTFDESLGNIDPDGDLWMRYSALGWRIVAVDGAAVFYRVHAGQTSAATELMLRGMTLTRIRMLKAVEAAGALPRLLSRAKWLLPLLLVWDLPSGVPACASYLFGRIADGEIPASAWVRYWARRTMADTRIAASFPTDEEMRAVEEASRAPEFERFLRLLKAERGNDAGPR